MGDSGSANSENHTVLDPHEKGHKLSFQKFLLPTRKGKQGLISGGDTYSSVISFFKRTFIYLAVQGLTVENLPAMWETWVQALGWEDPLEKGMATHSSILAWRISWTEECGGLHTVHGVTKSWSLLSNEHFHFHRILVSARGI